MGLFDVAIITIFAREMLEGTVIIGNYRTVIEKSPDFEDEERKTAALKAVTQAALISSLVAVVMIAILAISLSVASKELDNRVIELIEGVSKLVAAICIIGLSLKIPKWLGIYVSKKTSDQDGGIVGLSIKSIRFNVAWNIWREVAECGAFLIPFMLGGDAEAIPLSALVGLAIGGAIGIGVYFASRNSNDNGKLAFFLAWLTGQLAVGLFVGGCHEFEEVYGETPYVWKIKGDFWQHKKLPMAILKPFGYSSKRTVLQIITFWIGMVTMVGLHYWKWSSSKKIKAEMEAAQLEKKAETDEFDDSA